MLENKKIIIRITFQYSNGIKRNKVYNILTTSLSISHLITVTRVNLCLGWLRLFNDTDLLIRRHIGGNLRLLVFCQPVPSSELFPLRLHLIPELCVWLEESNRQRRTRGRWGSEKMGKLEGRGVKKRLLLLSKTTALIISRHPSVGNVTSVRLGGWNQWTQQLPLTTFASEAGFKGTTEHANSRINVPFLIITKYSQFPPERKPK